MFVKYYAVYDEVAKEFAPLFFAKNDDVARRMYKNVCVESRLDPNEFSLYFLMEIDNENGLVVTSDPREVALEVSVKSNLDGLEVVNE